MVSVTKHTQTWNLKVVPSGLDSAWALQKEEQNLCYAFICAFAHSYIIPGWTQKILLVTHESISCGFEFCLGFYVCVWGGGGRSIIRLHNFLNQYSFFFFFFKI